MAAAWQQQNGYLGYGIELACYYLFFYLYYLSSNSLQDGKISMGEQCGLNLISFTTGMAWLGEFGLAIWVRNQHFQNHHRHRHQYYLNHQRDNVAHWAHHLGQIGYCCDQPIWQWYCHHAFFQALISKLVSCPTLWSQYLSLWYCNSRLTLIGISEKCNQSKSAFFTSLNWLP